MVTPVHTDESTTGSGPRGGARLPAQPPDAAGPPTLAWRIARHAPSLLLANGSTVRVPGDANITSTTTLEFDFPPETFGDALLLAGFGLAAVIMVWLILRDAAEVSRGWRAWLLCLRMLMLAGLAVIALNPHRRTQQEAFRPSQVLLLVDTSTSMQQSAVDLIDGAAETARPPEQRWQAVRRLLEQTSLVESLREQHVVEVATFAEDLRSGVLRLPRQADSGRPVGANGQQGSQDSAGPEPERSGAEASAGSGRSPDWERLLQPAGSLTRLGDALDQLIAENRSETLAGVVVISDGASNAGRDPAVAQRRARRDGVPLFTVGVGGVRPPVNLQILRLIAPTDVQLGDAFDVTALLQSQGLEGAPGGNASGARGVTVELLRRQADASEPEVLDSQEAILPADLTPVEVTFSQSPREAETLEYFVRVRPPAGIRESRDDDNLAQRSVNVFDRPLRVLIMAGGPLRDYQFAKNALHRHPSVEVDVWLQTGQVGISQDAHELLFDFPDKRETLFSYDAILAFDPDWSLVPEAARVLLSEWISNEGGGLGLIAGDIHTPELSAGDATYDGIRTLYPVVLETVRPEFERRDRWNQPWKVGVTDEGRASALLNVADDLEVSMQLWESFPGVYRCYPTGGVKGGAVVYAEYTDPLSRTYAGAPVLLAFQRYGQGMSIYLGSPEMWRLRSYDEDLYDRFWIKLVRMAAEGRSKRGLQRGMLVLDSHEFGVGQTIPLRARVLSAAFEPLEAETLTLDVFDPQGRPVSPSPALRQDPTRKSEYVGDLRVTMAGQYRLELDVPDSSETVRELITVTLPRLEMESLRQEVDRLESLVKDTGGAYLTLAEAPEKLPALLENRGQAVVLDQQVDELWDRRWVLFLLAGLLAAEWLTRKLLKLA
jgi:hypothetical protein